MSFVGKLLQILGWGLAIWSVGVGLSFSAIFLMGFVGTGGREAGDQLVVMLLMTFVGFACGYVIAKFGKRLSHKGQQSAARDQSMDA